MSYTTPESTPEPRRKQVQKLATEALRALGSLYKDKDRFSAAELFEWVQKNKPEEAKKIPKSVWNVMLSYLVGDPSSGIIREPGRYGYMLRTQPGPIMPDVVVKGSGNAQRERCLYKVLQDWLQLRCDKVFISAFSKAGGPWGNPDIVGIKSYTGLDETIHLELTSVEAKISKSQWERNLFQAVAHRRFADRAYFAFGFPSDLVDMSCLPEYEKMREYAERFNIGILAVFVPVAIYEQLLKAKAPELSAADVVVVEVWPALYAPVPALTREQFIKEVLGISSLSEIRSQSYV